MKEILLHTLGDLHPLAVHFPIGIIGLLFILYLFSYFGKIQVPQTLFGFIHWVALAAIFLSIFLGLIMKSTRSYSGNDKTLLQNHQLMGFILFIVFLLATIFLHLKEKNKRCHHLYHIFFGLSLLVLAIGGHIGSTITHGEIKILKHLLKEQKTAKNAPAITTKKTTENTNSISYTIETTTVIEATKTNQKISFQKQIFPIFEENCLKCHGPKKQKGDLRLDAKDLSDVITPFKPEESELVKRITLPPDDEDFMPSDEDPLSEEAIQTIKEWIKQGAIIAEE